MPEENEELKFLDETFRDYAWRYFQLHAEQRLKAFQFFITLATAIVGGALLLFGNDQGHEWIAVFGFLLTFLSFVFWKLDVRTRNLVKNAEGALKFLDSKHQLPNIDDAPHPLMIFTRDDHFTAQAEAFPLSTGHFSYSRCFKYVFVAFATIGILAIIGGLIYKPVQPQDRANPPKAEMRSSWIGTPPRIT